MNYKKLSTNTKKELHQQITLTKFPLYLIYIQLFTINSNWRHCRSTLQFLEN